MVVMKNYKDAPERTNYHSVLMLLLNHHKKDALPPLITEKCHRGWREYLKIQWLQTKCLMNYTFN